MFLLPTLLTLRIRSVASIICSRSFSIPSPPRKILTVKNNKRHIAFISRRLEDTWWYRGASFWTRWFLYTNRPRRAVLCHYRTIFANALMPDSAVSRWKHCTARAIMAYYSKSACRMEMISSRWWVFFLPVVPSILRNAATIFLSG